MRNLFAEGNDLFKEKDFKLSLVQYVEGLTVADYAASDEVTIPKELLCKLHVNRAACYFAMVSAFPKQGRENAVVSLPYNWKRCQEGFHLVLSAPCSNTGEDDDAEHSGISPVLRCIL